MTAADRVAQGFPPHVEDPAVLARAAAIILGRGRPPDRTVDVEPRSADRPDGEERLAS